MKNLLRLTAILLWAPTLGSGQQGPLPEQGPPPTELVERNGFVTANNLPPSTENFEVHTVAMGDTLWAISQRYLNNPFLWPQLWETNEHIINPHWIYPGDSILIRPVTLITDAGPPPVRPPAPPPEPARQIQLPSRPNLTMETLPEAPPVVFNLPDLPPVSEVKASDLYCSGFITTMEVSEDLRVMVKFPATESVIATDADYVYLSRGSSSGITVGDLFTAVRKTRSVGSMRGGVGSLGIHYLESGQMRVIMVQPEFSVARVVHACDGIQVGDQLVGFQEINFPDLPENRAFDPMMPSTGGTTGAIAITRDALSTSGSTLFKTTSVVPGTGGRLGGISRGLAGSGQIVYIDLGTQDGIRIGDLFLIYRPLESSVSLYRLSGDAARRLAGQREVLGELVVLKVNERSASALITFSSGGVSPGDSVELR